MTDLLFARDGFPALAARLGELGTKKVMLICGPSRRFVDLAATALAKYAPVIFDGARVHVPVDTVARAGSELAATEADTIVAIGGGSAIGLGKALRRGARVNFAAVPTTYAGSEMTATYGVTQGGTKQTGRDPNVRPDVVLYDPTLTVDMPIALTTQSMFNALAHVLSVASNGIDHDVIEALRDGLRATEDLILNPRALVFREQAARAASACASVFDLGSPVSSTGSRTSSVARSISITRRCTRCCCPRSSRTCAPRRRGRSSRSRRRSIAAISMRICTTC